MSKLSLNKTFFFVCFPSFAPDVAHHQQNQYQPKVITGTSSASSSTTLRTRPEVAEEVVVVKKDQGISTDLTFHGQQQFQQVRQKFSYAIHLTFFFV
jgi:hypothetical protein